MTIFCIETQEQPDLSANINDAALHAESSSHKTTGVSNHLY